MKLGEYSESLFATHCMEKGYIVSKPFSHYTRYDLIIDVDNVLHRVQVKSTEYLKKKDNQCHVKIDYKKMRWIGLLFILKYLIRGMCYPLRQLRVLIIFQ